ncbi:hypothetical protein RB195_006856 [Necator americanus]|uniref:Uncharacterized protein n=1 Tax=Necator americanus TaxID=51031 RepID=A0ABR1BW95_NECAM
MSTCLLTIGDELGPALQEHHHRRREGSDIVIQYHLKYSRNLEWDEMGMTDRPRGANALYETKHVHRSSVSAESEKDDVHEKRMDLGCRIYAQRN